MSVSMEFYIVPPDTPSSGSDAESAWNSENIAYHWSQSKYYH